MFNGKITDVHAHLYTKNFLKELATRTSYPILRQASDGSNIVQFNEKQSNKVPNSFVDLEFRIRQMDKYGVTTQLLSATNPWTDSFPTAELALIFSKMINNEISEIVSGSNGRFFGLATLPLLSPKDAAEELARSIDELGLCGAILGTNVGGTHLSDPSFDPVFQVASKKRAILFLHPTSPLGGDKLKDYGFVRSIGYTFETTACILKMAYAGIFDKYPSLKVL
ncbi:MAG: amidohydrolase family protein, partial [Nitrososphaerota archaeon]|nr:amidohydrolase family protein [Nitrososphaerota archaeon]